MAGGYGPVPPGYGGGHSGDAFVGQSMSGPGPQYRGMNYPAGYPPASSVSMDPHPAGHYAGPGAGGPGPVTSVSGDTAASVGRAGSTASEDHSSAVPTADNVGLNSQQTVSSDASKDSNVPSAVMDGNHARPPGPPPTVDDNFGRQNLGPDGRPVYPMGTDGANVRYGQPGMDVRGMTQKQMFGQMPSRSALFMNMNGVAIRPGQLPFGPDGAQGRGVEGMGVGAGSQPGEMMPDQPQDGLQRRPAQSMPPDGMFGRQAPPPFGMDGRLGPAAGMDPMMRRTGHLDDGTMNRPGPNVDPRASMHGMPVRTDPESSVDDNFRQGPQPGPPGNMQQIRPGMENMPGRPLPPQMCGLAEGVNMRSMQPQHASQTGMDVMPGRPGQMRMDAMERRGGIAEGMGPGPHSQQHPGYSHQYPGYGSHPAAAGHTGHGPPPSGFSAPDANASGDQMFRNHMPAHAVPGDGRGAMAPGGDGYRPGPAGAEFAADQRHFMPNGDVDMMRRAGEPPYAPKNFDNGEYGFVTCTPIDF